MKRSSLFLIGIFLSIFSTSIYSQDYAMTAPIGYGASATGGTGGTVVTVSNLNDFKTQVSSTGKKIILVSGTINFTGLYSVVIKDKTIIGLPGATLANLSGRDKSSSGILNIKSGSSNVIIRNLTFKGAGAYDCDGSDNLCIDGGTNIWVDHCDFQDGVDGNFDNKGKTDNITISWCRFRYLIAPKAGGSGGSDDHRFTNLLGSSASDKPTDGTYNITWAYCWWDEGCKERMVRGRNAELHFLNCYWNSSVANYYIGPENMKAYIEGCYFEGKPSSSNIWKSYGGTNPVKFVNSYGKNGLPANSGTVNVPSYSYTALSYADARSAVTDANCGAGATLQVNPTTGAVSAGCNATEPTIQLTSAAGTNSQSLLANNPITNIVYTMGGSATSFQITYSGGSTTKPSWMTAQISGKTLTFSGTPNVSVNTTYTIKVKATDGTKSTEEQTITIAVTVPAPATLDLTSGSATQTAYLGTAISNIVYTYGGGATGVNVTGLPTGVTFSTNASDKRVTISGIPTVTGSFNFTVTTIGGSTNTSKNGSITVNAPTMLGLPVATYTVSGSTATVSWAAVTGTSSYNVKVCSSSGASGTTDKDWDFNSSTFSSLSGSISSTTTIDGLTFVYSGSALNAVTGKAKTYSDGFAGGGKVIQTGGSSSYSDGMPTKRYMTFVVDGPVKITAWFFGNSTGDRSLLISAGTTETEMEYNSTDQAATIATYNYTGSGSTIYVYSNNSINISRIKVEPAAATTCTEKSVSGFTTTITSFDAATGSIYVQAVSNSPAYTTGEYAKATSQNVAVNATLALTSSVSTTSQTKTTGSELSAITYSYTGTPTIEWTGTTNSTTAPAGITVNISANTIAVTGTPTAAGNFGYTVKAMPINGGTPVAGITLTGTITVIPAPIDATLALDPESMANATVSVGGQVNIEYDYTGATPVITWSGSSTSNPAGITVETGGDYIIISGIPTVPGTYNYTINVAGLNGGVAAAPKNGTITVNAALITPTNVTASPTSNSITVSWDANTEATAFKVKLCGAAADASTTVWNFNSWTIDESDADANLVVDGTNPRFNYAVNPNGGELKFASGTIIPDLAGLKFTVASWSNTKLRLGYGSGQIYLNGTNIKVEIPCAVGDIVTIIGPAGNATAVNRGYTVTGGTLQNGGQNNIDVTGIMNVAGAVGTWIYEATSTTLSITTTGGGMNIQSITVSSPDAVTCNEYDASGTSKTISGLDPNAEYTYQVKALRNTEETAYSVAKTISTIDNIPQAATITLTSNITTVAQTVVVGTAIVPIIYDYTGSGATVVWSPSTPVGINDSTVGSVNISGMPSQSGTYTYTVNVTGINGGQSAQAIGTVTVLDSLTVPANVVATPTATTIGLTWDVVTGAEKYVVNLCHEEETEGAGAGTPTVSTWLTSSAAYNSTSKSYDVVGIGSYYKGTSGGTATINDNFGGGDCHGSNKNIVMGSSLFIFKADKAISKITVYGNSGTGSNRTLATTNPITTSTTLAGTYTAISADDYTVDVTNNNINGKHESVACSGTSLKITFDNVIAAGTFIKITLTGNAYVSAIEYETPAEGGDSGGGSGSTELVCNTYETNTNSITISDLTANTEYSYQVKAVRGTEATNYNTAEKITTLAAKIDPSAPTGITATYGQTLLNVTLPTGWTWVNSAASVGNAGSQTHKANYAGDANYNAASNVDVTVTVSKASVTKPALEINSFTFDNTSKTVSLNASGVYTFGGTTSATNAGNYTATVTLTDKTNYQWTDASTTDLSLAWDISKANVSAPTGLTATYGQTLANVTLPAGWSWVTASTSVGNVGSQTHKANYAGDANYNAASNVDVTIIVNKAAAPSAPTGLSATYGQTLANVTLPAGWSWVTASTSVGNVGSQTHKANYAGDTNYNAASNVDVTITVNKAAAPSAPTGLTATYGQTLANVTLPTGWTWVNSAASVGNAGSQTHKANYAGDANYNAASNVDVTITVNKAAAPSAPTGLSATYGQTLSNVTLPSGWSWVTASTSVGNVGSQTHKANYAGDANYNSASNVDVTVSVSKASVTKPALEINSFTFDNTNKTVSLNASGVYTFGGTTSATNAGNYTATVTLTDKTNYQWTDASTTDLSLAWDISKANVSAPTGLTATYGQTLANVTLPAGWSWVTASTSVGNVGSQTHKANYAGDTNYNAASNVDVTITVNKAAAPSAPTGLTATYGQTLANVTLPTGWTWVNSAASVGNAGSQTHKANYAGDANYNAASNVDVTITVNKAAAPSAPTDLTAIYGQTLSSVTLPAGWFWVTASASVGNDGTQTHKANYAGDTNYESASNIDVTITVSPPTTIDESTADKLQIIKTTTELKAIGVDVAQICLYAISGQYFGCVSSAVMDISSLIKGTSYIAQIRTVSGKLILYKFIK